MDDYLIALGNRLKEARRKTGLSQQEFGAAGGVMKNAQLAYEQGKRAPDAAYFYLISALGVDVGYVLTGQLVASVLPEEESMLLQEIRWLDACGRRSVAALIKGLNG